MIDRIEFELQQCVENRCRPDLNDIDAANLLAGIAQLRADLSEQCPLLGMSGEREARLMARLAESQARELRLREALRLCSGVLEEDGRDATVWHAQSALEATSDDSALREMIASALDAVAEEPPINGNELAQIRVRMKADAIRARSNK